MTDEAKFTLHRPFMTFFDRVSPLAKEVSKPLVLGFVTGMLTGSSFRYVGKVQGFGALLGGAALAFPKDKIASRAFGAGVMTGCAVEVLINEPFSEVKIERLAIIGAFGIGFALRSKFAFLDRQHAAQSETPTPRP